MPELPKEFNDSWPVLIASAVGIGLGLSPLPFYTIGVFIGPISQEFGWQPSQVLTAVTVYTATVVIMAPFIGMITDRVGARKVVLTSILLFGLSMMAQSLHTGSMLFYWFLWSLIAIFGAGTLPIAFTKAVNNLFHQHRGKALGIALVSTGIFGSLAKFFAAQITEMYGWRTAYIALGSLPILIAFPIALVAFRDVTDAPEQRSPIHRFRLAILSVAALGMIFLAYFVLAFILPASANEGWKLQYIVGIVFIGVIFLSMLLLMFSGGRIKKTEIGLESKSLSVSGMTIRDTLADWRFWMLALSFVVISVSIGAVIPNLEQILVSKGFSMKEAVGLAVLTGLAVLSGRVIGGFLIDKYWAPAIAFIFLASPAIALYLLSEPLVSNTAATVAIMMIGFGAGVEYDFLAYLVSRYFGMRSYATIYGALYSFFAIGAGFGPVILSRMAEMEGAWSRVLIYAAIALLLASLPLLTLGKYRSFEC